MGKGDHRQQKEKKKPKKEKETTKPTKRRPKAKGKSLSSAGRPKSQTVKSQYSTVKIAAYVTDVAKDEANDATNQFLLEYQLHSVWAEDDVVVLSS